MVTPSKDKFNYKNGEDYTCSLCGQEKHTSGPRPDKLCDPCWELKWRVEKSPELAFKVLQAKGYTGVVTGRIVVKAGQ